MRVSLSLPALLAAGLVFLAPAAAQEDPDAPAAEAGDAEAAEEPEPSAERRAVIDAVSEALDEIDREAAEPDEPPAEDEEAPADTSPRDTAEPEDAAAEPEAEAPAMDEAVPAEPPAPAPPLTSAERAQVAAAAERGRQLSAIAQAAIRTTRDMLSRIADPDAEGIVGWVAEPEGNAMAVSYYAEEEDGPVLVYRGRVLGGRVVSRDLFLSGERPALTGRVARMAAARAAADALGNEPCGGAPFNVLVMPPELPDSPIDVYQFTAPTGPGSFPFGGHYRTTVGPDGEVESSRSFANSCLLVEAPELPDGAQPRPIGITHLLDPLPTEAHVFLARLTGYPLLVATGSPSRLWLVTGESIAEIRD